MIFKHLTKFLVIFFIINQNLYAQCSQCGPLNYVLGRLNGNIKSVKVEYHELNSQESFGLNEINFEDETKINLEFDEKKQLTRFVLVDGRSRPFDDLDEITKEFPRCYNQNDEKSILNKIYQAADKADGVVNMTSSQDITLFYDDKNNLNEIIYKNTKKIVLIYDEWNNLLSKDFYNIYIDEDSYDDNGHFDKKYEFYLKIKYDYNKTKLITSHVYDKNGIETNRYIYNYDPKEMKSMTLEYASKNDKPSFREKVELNSNGNPIFVFRSEGYWWKYSYKNDKISAMQIKSSYMTTTLKNYMIVYDQNGNIIELYVDNKLTNKWEYIYDSHTNWTERRQFGFKFNAIELNPEFVIRREINY